MPGILDGPDAFHNHTHAIIDQDIYYDRVEELIPHVELFLTSVQGRAMYQKNFHIDRKGLAETANVLGNCLEEDVRPKIGLGALLRRAVKKLPQEDIDSMNNDDQRLYCTNVARSLFSMYMTRIGDNVLGNITLPLDEYLLVPIVQGSGFEKGIHPFGLKQKDVYWILNSYQSHMLNDMELTECALMQGLQIFKRNGKLFVRRVGYDN